LYKYLWYKIAVLIFFLNAFDAFLTCYELHVGIIIESNPIMNALIGVSMWLFILFKLLIGFLMGWVTIKYNKKYKIARFGAVFIVIIYTYVMGIHVKGLFF
jgi:hypothetical protein